MALALLSSQPTILVQSGLYPHAGYSSRIQLLTPQTARDPAFVGGVALLAPSVSAYPLDADERAKLARLPSVGTMPPGLIAVRLLPPPPQ